MTSAEAETLIARAWELHAETARYRMALESIVAAETYEDNFGAPRAIAEKALDYPPEDGRGDDPDRAE